MYNKEKALKILEVLNEKKLIKVSEEKHFVDNIVTMKFYYDSESTKENHILNMKNFDWNVVDGKKREGVYYKKLNDKDNIYVYCACFEKRLDDMCYLTTYSNPFTTSDTV